LKWLTDIAQAIENIHHGKFRPFSSYCESQKPTLLDTPELPPAAQLPL